MLKRFTLAIVWIVLALTTAVGQTDQTAPHRDGGHPRAQRASAPPPPPPKEWIEQTIDKFLDIPSDIFDPKPDQR